MFRGREHAGAYRGYYFSLDNFALLDFIPGAGPGVGYHLLAAAELIERKQGELLDVVLSVEGMTITAWVNGQKVLHYQDKRRLYTVGGIALRCNRDGKMSVKQFEIGIPAQ